MVPDPGLVPAATATPALAWTARSSRLRLWKQLHDHVTRNHRHRTIEPPMEVVDDFIEGAQPFPGTKVSMLGHPA